jgi:hypothetical protein
MTSIPIERLRRAPWARRRLLIPLGLVAVVALGASIAVAMGLGNQKPDIRDGTTLVDNEGLAQRYGINIKLIALSAAGGLVDFRYQVVDPDKADSVIHNVKNYPKLIVEETGETIVMTSLPHSHNSNSVQVGGTYFFLLANSHNAIHKGSRLTVVVGDARVEHYVVQG